MEIVSETIQDIVGRIAKAFEGFTSAEIGSKEYANKGEALETLVVALARNHPRWSAEEETILPWTVENAALNQEAECHEYSEDLFHAWRLMKASRPTADSLREGLPLFTRALGPLCRVTDNTFSY